MISHYCKQFSYIRAYGNIGGYTGGNIFKTQRKRNITVQTNKWRPLVNEHTSGAPYRIVNAPNTNHRKTMGNCHRSVRHYFWLFFTVLTTETDVWEV